MLKSDGTPMSRQQVHMLRKKARGICLTCGAPAIGVYCLKHTIAAREAHAAETEIPPSSSQVAELHPGKTGAFKTA